MPTPKKPAAPTLARRVAALEEKCLDQSIDLALLRDHMDGRLAEQREWFREAIAEAEQRIIGRQGFDRIGTLRREFMDGADFVYKELRRMREQAESFVEGFGLVEAMLAEMAGNMESLGRQVSEIEAERPALESSRERAERAVEQIQAMLADPRLAQGAPAVAAPAHDPASGFPAGGLVQVSMGEIGGKPCPVVDARELHSFIGSKDNFSNWISDQIERARLKENKHFGIYRKKPVNSGRGRPGTDYLLTLDGAKHIAMVANTDKAFEVRDYFIECEERLREILIRPAQQAAIREASDTVPTAVPAERQATPDETLPVHYYTAADPLFMACIVLTEKTVVCEREGDEWKSTRTFRPSDDMLMRNAKALAYLLRAIPRKSAGWRYTQYELAIQADLTACHLRESLGHLEALEFVAIKRINRGKKGPTFDLRMLWENIEAAARRDGVDLAALAGTPS